MAKKTAKKKTKKPAAKRKGAKKRPAKSPVERRADFGEPVTAFFNTLPAAQRPIAQAAHKALLKAAPDLEHSVKWGLANYLFPGSKMKDGHGFAIYASDKSVNLAVGRGGELANKHAKLQGTGKSMRHVKLYSVADANSAPVAAILNDAVALMRDK